MRHTLYEHAVNIRDRLFGGHKLFFFPAARKEGEEPRPFALILPGGGYSFVSVGFEGLPTARFLNSRGVTAFVLRYDTGRKGRYPAPQREVAEAVAHILANADGYGVSAQGYSVWGYSAGGHLAASFGTDAMGYKNYGVPAPALLVLGYPVITMRETGAHPCLRNLFGKDLSAFPFGSIEGQITADYPPTYVWCCEGDNIVSDNNTRLMRAALEARGVPCRGGIFSGVRRGHGISIGTGTAAEGWADEALAFWRELCGGRKQGEPQI